MKSHFIIPYLTSKGKGTIVYFHAHGAHIRAHRFVPAFSASRGGWTLSPTCPEVGWTLSPNLPEGVDSLPNLPEVG